MPPFLRLFLELNLRAALRKPAATLAAIAAIGVGTGVICAVDLANAAAIRALGAAVEAVGGKATHEIRGGAAGVPEDVLTRAPRLPGVVAAAGVIEGVVTPADDPRRPLFVFGVDLLAAPAFRSDDARLAPDQAAFERLLGLPGAVAATSRTAGRLGLGVGDSFAAAGGGARSRMTLVAILPDAFFGQADEDRLVVDLATAQEVFGRGGFVDRIDLILPTDADPEPTRAALGPGLDLSRPERRAGADRNLVRSFRLNLLALSTLATFVGAYLAFNAAQYNAVVRRRAVAQARCFGARRRDVLGAFLLEGVFVGVFGGFLGAILGASLAPIALDAVARTTDSLYAAHPAATAGLDQGAVLRAFLIGVAAAVLAGFFPARDAARTTPRAALSRAPAEESFAGTRTRLYVVAALGLAAAILGPLVPSDDPAFGYVAVTGILAAAAALSPLCADLGYALIARFAVRAERPGVHHAAVGLRRDLARAGAAQAALAAALAVTLGVVTMVGSFRDTVTLWLDQVLRADVYVGPSRPAAPFDPATVPEAVATELSLRPDVAHVAVVRGGGATLPDGSKIFLTGVDAADAAGSWWFLHDARRDDVAARLSAGECIVSESLARRRGLAVGGPLALPGLAGPRDVRIAAVFRDYSVDAGYAAVDLKTYRAMFGDVPPRGMALTARPGTSSADLARDVQATVGARYAVRAYANAELKQDAIRTFERTFAVTTFLRGVAVAMAFLGAAVALFARALERRRETAVLRAVGMTRGGAIRLALLQGALFTAPPALLGATAGIFVAKVLTDVVNLRAFGWSLLWSPSFATSASLVAVTIAVGALAAAAPQRRMLRSAPAAALREE